MNEDLIFNILNDKYMHFEIKIVCQKKTNGSTVRLAILKLIYLEKKGLPQSMESQRSQRFLNAANMHVKLREIMAVMDSY